LLTIILPSIKSIKRHAMTDLTRLDRIDLTLEVVTQAQLDFARSLQHLTQRIDGTAGQMDRLVGQVEQVITHIGALADSQRTLIENQRALLESQQSLAESVGQLTNTIIPRLQENQASTGAAIERLDRVLDYLLRQGSVREP
jgi:chromosome segregation ATPase